MFKSKKQKIMLTVLFIIILFKGLSNINEKTESNAVSPTEVRAAIDIGSGATKLKVAEVNTKTHKITRIVFEDELPVAYQSSLADSPDNTFPQEIVEQGIEAIQTLKEKANQHCAKRIAAVATAAFRQAKNAPALVDKIRKQTGIDVKVISQKQEGVLGFNGLMAANEKADAARSVVWDIGGGSLQLTAKDHNNEFIVYEGTMASIPFRDHIIGHIQGHTLSITKSPNPISLEHASLAMQHAELAAFDVSPDIQQKIKENTSSIFAVGSLFQFGVKSAVGNKVITQESLHNTIHSLIGQDDKQLGGQFADVKLSNLILVLGMMKKLDIKELTIEPVNNADGILIDSSYDS